MTFLTLLLLQAANDPAPIRFDLSKVEVPKGCLAPARSGEIMVCGRRRLPDRLQPMPVTEEEGLPKAEMRVFGNVRGSIRTEQVMIGGAPSNRAMITLRTPF